MRRCFAIVALFVSAACVAAGTTSGDTGLGRRAVSILEAF
jgi:hypothetical protein